MAGVEGRIALVTGAGRGIGRAVAELLAARGARVMGISRSEQELAALGLEYTVADLGTPDGCALAVAETERCLGPIDILVCNHGIGSAHERVIWEQDPKVWSETMQINLDGPFHLSRLVLRGMVERSYGRLVYTSSTAGLVAEYAGSAYTVAKHGLIGLMRSIAQDAGTHGIMAGPGCPVSTGPRRHASGGRRDDRFLRVGRVERRQRRSRSRRARKRLLGAPVAESRRRRMFSVTHLRE